MLYRITEMPEMLKSLSEILVASAREVQKAVLTLPAAVPVAAATYRLLAAYVI